MAENGGMDENAGNAARTRRGSGLSHSMFRGPLSSSPPAVDSTSLWTQFSGMPSQPGSPSSLHQWLHAMDGAGLSSDIFPRGSAASSGAGFTSTTAPMSVGSMHPGLHSRPAEVGHLGQDDNLSAEASSTSQRFDFGSPPDFPHTQTHRFSNSPLGDIPHSPSVDFGLPPADFSRPPPDFAFGTPPDFSRPPPPFKPDVLHSTFSAVRTQASQQHNFSQSTSLGDCGRHSSDLSFDTHLHYQPAQFEPVPHQEQSIPKSSHIFTGSFDVGMPPSPNFMPFPVVADDILQVSNEFDARSQDFDFSSPEQDFAQNHKSKKVLRQNSEPAYKTTAEQEGKALYVEALRRLNSFGPSYEPFGLSSPEQDMPSETTVAESLIREAPLEKPVKNDAPKMSYSEVARCTKGRSSQLKSEPVPVVMKEKDGGETEMQAKKSAFETTTSAKPFRQHKRQSHLRSSGHRSRSSGSETGQGFVQPASKYGLDQFEDMPEYTFGRGEHCSSSVESLNSPGPSARESSTSSMGSCASTVDEVLQGKVGAVSSSRKSDGMNSRQKDKISNLDTKQPQTDNRVNSHTTDTSTTFFMHHSQKTTICANATKGKNDKLFFDPKRIFQGRGNGTKAPSTGDKIKMKGESARQADDKTDIDKEETILNNGKPNNTSCKATSATHRKADYINNDLREGTGGGGGGGSNSAGSKRTNQTAALNRHNQGVHSKRHSSQKDSCTQNGSSDAKLKGGEARNKKSESSGTAGNSPEKKNSFIRNIDWVLIDEWMKYISDCSMTFAKNSASAVVTILLYLVGAIMYLVMGVIHLIAIGIGKIWNVIKGKLFKGDDSGPDGWGSFATGADSSRKRIGLEENIALPATGEEAMKRLLACKGKDPYSILGLRSDTSDEDIKRYYRKQAVLVHPDKNQEPGAEEAFKILGHAFEMIGEPAKRKEYDAHIVEASEAEAAMREFSDLLTKLQEKVQEAANMMRCDNCGKKHQRIPVDRPWYSARYCQRCNIHHSAKEGDVWAESSILGFLWHYYACMDGNIYDITEWVSCQRENFKHMKANAHPVFYRIQTDGNRRHRHGQSGEADLEDFINRLFNKASMNPDGASSPGWQFPSQQQGAGAGAPSGWGNSAGPSNTKRSRRRKKRN